MSSTPPDPTAFFREWVSQWEKAANSFGGEAMKTPEFAQAMGGATAATTTMQAGIHQMMERALAAANLPSRTEIEDLSARLARIEASLARIEAATGAAADRDRPKPSRTRQPPADA